MKELRWLYFFYFVLFLFVFLLLLFKENCKRKKKETIGLYENGMNAKKIDDNDHVKRWRQLPNLQ